jgi:integrase/recombinase XerD
MTKLPPDTMTKQIPEPALTLDDALECFLRMLRGRNLSNNTLVAYRADVAQFTRWVESSDISITRVDQVTRNTINDYLAYLAGLGFTGVTRARKLAALRELFRYLVADEVLSVSPTASVGIPKKERKQRVLSSARRVH